MFKKIWKASLFCFGLIIIPWLAYVSHGYLYGLFHLVDKGFKSPDVNYINAIRALITTKEAKLWTCVYIVIFLGIYFYVTLMPKAELASVKEISVTDKIKIPVAVGSGQHGNARFSTEEEQKAIFDSFLFTGKETPKNGGLVIGMEKRGDSEIIRYVGDDLHSIILGTTGSGKSRRVILQTIWMQIMSGKSVVVSDVKGELYYYTSEYAKSMGYEVLTLDLRSPQKGHHYNFLQPVLDYLEEGNTSDAISATWDIVSVLVGEPKGEKLWNNGESATIAAGILIVCMEAPKKCRNFTNVYYFLAYMCRMDSSSMDMFISKYLRKFPKDHPARIVFAMAELAVPRTRSSFFTSALGTLKLFTDKRIAEMTSKSDFKLDDIGSKKTILYMIVPDEKKTRYPLVSIFVTQLYMSQVELANRNGLTLPIPCDYDLDEVANFPYIPVLGAIASAGRTRGVRINLLLQEYQQLEQKYKDEYETIKTCCRVKLYLLSDNAKTLKEISENLGTYTVEVTSSSSSINNKLGSSGGSVSSSGSMASRALLTPSELALMEEPYALCMYMRERPSIVKLPDISQYKLNSIYGLGSKEHNAKISMERESQREERKTTEIPLWGIWNEYVIDDDLEEEDLQEYEKVSFLKN